MDPRELQRFVKELPSDLAGVFLVDEDHRHVPAKSDNFKICWWVQNVPGEPPKFFTEKEKTLWDADRGEEILNPPLAKLEQPVLVIEI